MENIFLPIVKMSISASVVALVVLIIRWLLGNKFHKSFSYALWALVFIRLVLPYSIPSVVSIFNKVPIPSTLSTESKSYSMNQTITSSKGTVSTSAEVHTNKAMENSDLISTFNVVSPKLIIVNDSLAESLGFDVEELKGKAAVSVFAGNSVTEGASPIAQAYAGHQFGHLTMLGDGRAVLLGEQISPQGQPFDIQLKGSGPTPYSRGGDGRAALGPMLREYIVSEAMYALGIPTTRSLAVVTTGEPVYRETKLRGAILTRVAASHIRVGTFEYAAMLNDVDKLKALADYTIQRHFPYIATSENPYLAFLKEVVKGQASLMSTQNINL